MYEKVRPVDDRRLIELVLPVEVHEKLARRVSNLDTSIPDWITTVIIEALERPDDRLLGKGAV